MSANYRLEDLLREVVGRPVVWGGDDCIIFAGDASRLQTGRDPIAPLRDAWNSRVSAYRVISAKGDDLVTAMAGFAAEFGYPEIDPAAAQLGDLGVLLENDIPTAACLIAQGWIARNELGFSVRPTVLRAWSVGR